MVILKVYGLTRFTDKIERRKISANVLTLKREIVDFLPEILKEDPAPFIFVTEDCKIQLHAKLSAGLYYKLRSISAQIIIEKTPRKLLAIQR